MPSDRIWIHTAGIRPSTDFQSKLDHAHVNLQHLFVTWREFSSKIIVRTFSTVEIAMFSFSCHSARRPCQLAKKVTSWVAIEMHWFTGFEAWWTMVAPRNLRNFIPPRRVRKHQAHCQEHPRCLNCAYNLKAISLSASSVLALPLLNAKETCSTGNFVSARIF